MLNLYEHYRPTTMNEVVGHTAAKQAIRSALDFGWGGKAWWIQGPSGSGKTTLARIIAKMGAEDLYITEFDSGDEVGAATMDDIVDQMCYRASGKGGRAFIINEAHGLRAPIVRRLLGVLERIPGHICFIFTTTAEGQLKLFDGIDASPLLSRCTPVELTTKTLIKPFAKHAKWIAKREKLDGRPLSEYVALVEQCQGNMRMVLQQIQAGVMRKKA